ncbi:MAG: response regulator [Synechococcales cyanobacterium RU_4_20]|nr:response regulator [Synechococcales cyanobacterium RU_4_20]NJR70683.1 response regulator [Synechococcales cyanobacterium CRU_2_2]
MATILLVEDTASERQLMTQYLQEAGHLIIDASNGTEALQKLESNKPDVIVTDVVMPGMSGLELCRNLKKNPATKDLPIVACSSKDQDLDKMWALKQGIDVYITKPYSKADIVNAVSSVTG